MSVWTKEQEEYLDKRFLPLERDVKELKEGMKEVKSRLSNLESGMQEVKSNIGKILTILKQK